MAQWYLRLRLRVCLCVLCLCIALNVICSTVYKIECVEKWQTSVQRETSTSQFRMSASQNQKLSESSDAGDNESHLARIENVPEHPMDLFASFKAAIEPHLPFPNVMCIATVNKWLSNHSQYISYSLRLPQIAQLFVDHCRENGVLNRNVLLRKFDNDGFVFVTERDSRKYADLVWSARAAVVSSPRCLMNDNYSSFYLQKANPEIAATFLWIFAAPSGLIYRQVSVTLDIF